MLPLGVAVSGPGGLWAGAVSLLFTETVTRADYPVSTYAVLGLVDKVPDSSGYDLAAIADRSLQHFWPVSHTLMYRELKRLTDLGWVTSHRVEQVVAPDKSIYQITPEGRAALRAWLHAEAPMATTYRSAFLLRFFLAHAMRPERIAALLAQYRTALGVRLDALQAVADQLKDTPRARMARLTALHGIRTLTAQLDWVDEVEAELATQDGPGPASAASD